MFALSFAVVIQLHKDYKCYFLFVQNQDNEINEIWLVFFVFLDNHVRLP